MRSLDHDNMSYDVFADVALKMIQTELEAATDILGGVAAALDLCCKSGDELTQAQDKAELELAQVWVHADMAQAGVDTPGHPPLLRFLRRRHTLRLADAGDAILTCCYACMHALTVRRQDG